MWTTWGCNDGRAEWHATTTSGTNTFRGRRVAQAANNITERRLNWYGRVMRGDEEQILRKVLRTDTPRNRMRGRLISAETWRLLDWAQAMDRGTWSGKTFSHTSDPEWQGRARAEEEEDFSSSNVKKTACTVDSVFPSNYDPGRHTLSIDSGVPSFSFQDLFISVSSCLKQLSSGMGWWLLDLQDLGRPR